jgi:hypothetical protein
VVFLKSDHGVLLFSEHDSSHPSIHPYKPNSIYILCDISSVWMHHSRHATASSFLFVFRYFVGRFGLFGAKKESIANVPLNTVGVLFAFISLLCYLFIDPPPPAQPSDEEKLLSESSEIVNVAEEEEEETPTKSSHVSKKNKNKNGAYMGIKSPFVRRILGIFMALTAGTLYGVALVPFTVWDQHRKDDVCSFTTLHAHVLPSHSFS